VLLDASKFYRIIVRVLPRDRARLLDVDPVTGGLKNVKTAEVVQFQDGRTLPIKVRIEEGHSGQPIQVITSSGQCATLPDCDDETGFAGASFPDNWLPARALAAGSIKWS